MSTLNSSPPCREWRLLEGYIVEFEGKDGEIALDQIRTIDKKRLIRQLGKIDFFIIIKIKKVLKEMFID